MATALAEKSDEGAHVPVAEESVASPLAEVEVTSDAEQRLNRLLCYAERMTRKFVSEPEGSCARSALPQLFPVADELLQKRKKFVSDAAAVQPPPRLTPVMEAVTQEVVNGDCALVIKCLLCEN